MDETSKSDILRSIQSEVSAVKADTAAIKASMDGTNKVVDKHNGMLDNLRVHCSGRESEMDQKFIQTINMVKTLSHSVGTLNHRQRSITDDMIRVKVDVTTLQSDKAERSRYKFWLITTIGAAAIGSLWYWIPKIIFYASGGS